MLQLVGNGGLILRVPMTVVEESGTDVVEERDVVLPCEGRQLGCRGRRREPDQPVVRGVDLQDHAGLVRHGRAVVADPRAVRRPDLRQPRPGGGAAL